MGPRTALLFIFVCLLSVSITGCGGSDRDIDPNESETTRAIREKVRAEMEVERLQRLAPRLAHADASAAAAPSAAGVHIAASDDEAAEPDDSTPIERGGELYARNCASCHGSRGAGDGPVGGSLVPQPAKHSDGLYMNALSNDHLFKVIKDGGPAVGKAATMAPWGASISDDRIQDLVVFVRSLAEPAYDGPMP